MRQWFLISLMAISFGAQAQMDDRASSTPHNVSLLGSMNRGGFAFGAAYEYMYDQSVGIGGHFRSFSKDDDVAANGLMIFGATLGHHFYKKSWDLAFTPSFNIIQIDSYRTRPDDTTTMGPGLAISLVWSIADKFGVGFDYNNYWVWFDDDYAGAQISDLAFKLRLTF